MSLLTGNTYIDIAVLLITAFMSIKLYFNRAFGYWKNKGVATLPPEFLFGNARDIILQKLTNGDVFRKYYTEMKQKGLKYCGFYSFAVPSFVVLDLELLKAITTRDFHYFTDRGIYSNEEIDPLSAHLPTLNGSTWKNMRAKLSPTFTSGKMKMMFTTLLDCSKDLIVVMDDIVKNHEIFDSKEILGRFTTDVIGSCAFGIECNSLRDPNAEFVKYGRLALGHNTIGQLKNLLAFFAPKIMEIFKLRFVDPKVSEFFIKSVKETIQYREENNVIRKDFMHLLIQLKNNVKIEDGDEIGELKTKHANNEMSLTVEQVAAEAFVFFVAGFETSSATLTFCFYELASNLEIQERLRNEIKKVITKHDGKFTYDAMMEMTFMDKCIYETLRKHPAVPTFGRQCTETYQVPDSDVVIEKGTQLLIPVEGIHHDPEYYPDPEKFDPERFSPENKSTRPHFAWIPFGEGPRMCIGMRFGLMQMKVGLTVLLQRYRFTLNSKTEVPLVMDTKALFPLAKGGIWLNVEKI